MPDEHPVRTSIIGSAAGGIIVAVVLWAIGYLGAAWRLAVSVLSSAWDLITASVRVPVAVVAVVLAYCVILTLRRRRWARAPAADVRFLEAERSPRDLDRTEKRVMKALADWEGDAQTSEVAEALGLNRLRVDQTVEQLAAAGLVTLAQDDSGGYSVAVTRAGRDYLIAKRHA